MNKWMTCSIFWSCLNNIPLDIHIPIWTRKHLIVRWQLNIFKNRKPRYTRFNICYQKLQNIHYVINVQITLNGEHNNKVYHVWVFIDDRERWYESFIINLCASATSFVRYLTFDTYCWTNQHVEYIVEIVHYLYQMKEQLLGINILFGEH